MPIYFVFALTLFSMTSLAASRVLIVLFALELDARPLTIGLVGATFSLFPMLLAWPAGKLTERLGPRGPLTFGSAVGACGLLLAYFVPTLPVLFVAAALSGVASTFFNLSLQISVGSLSTVANRARNFSNFAMVIAVTNGIGPLFAGFTIDRAGHGITFLCIAALACVPVGMLFKWGGMLPGGRRDSAPSQGVRHTLTNPQIWPVLAASAFAQCALEVFHVYIPVYATAHGLSASATGVIIAGAAVGGFLVRLQLTRLIAWRHEEKVLAYAFSLAALAFVAVPFFTTALPLALVAFVFGCGVNCTQPITLILLYNRSPKGRSGEAFGLRFALDNTLRLTGPIVFGMVATVLSLGAIFWINALVLGAGAAIAGVEKRRKKTER